MRIHQESILNAPSATERPAQEPLDESRRELAARYVPLALSIARKFSYGWSWLRDEMESAALVALVEAARNFDSARNVKFSTFLRKRLVGALLDTRKQMCQSFAKVDYLHLGESGDEWGSTKTVSNLSQDELSDLEEKYSDLAGISEDGPLWEVRDYLQDAFRRLPGRHRDLMSAIYLEHRSIDEISDSFRCSKSRLMAVHRESIDMLIHASSITQPKSKRRASRRSGGSEFSLKTIPPRETEV